MTWRDLEEEIAAEFAGLDVFDTRSDSDVSWHAIQTSKNARRAMLGACVQCGSRLARQDKRTCQRCANRAADRAARPIRRPRRIARAREERIAALGNVTFRSCSRCSGDAMAPFAMCSRCRLDRRLEAAAHRARVKARAA